MNYVLCKLLELHESMTANCMFMLITATFMNNKKDSCFGGLGRKLTHTIEKKRLLGNPNQFYSFILYIYISWVYMHPRHFFHNLRKAKS